METLYQNALIFDLGNTKLKARLLDLRTNLFVDVREDYQSKWLDRIVAYVANCDGATIAAISSVNTNREEELLGALRNIPNCNIIDGYKLISCSEIDFSLVEGFGLDRAFGLIGALEQSQAPLITVDCGTAITVNVLNPERKFLGGAILPGFSIQFKCLFEKTKLLPLVSLEDKANAIGANTYKAIQSGVYHSCTGGAIQLIKKIKRNELKDYKPSIILTGGQADIMACALEDEGIDYELTHDLLLNGIERTLKRHLHQKR